MLFYSLLTCLGLILMLISRYLKEGDRVFLDSYFYFSFFCVLYIGVPAIYFSLIPVTVVGAALLDLVFAIKYSIYFIFVVLIFNVLSLIKNKTGAHRLKLIRVSNISVTVPFFIMTILALYVLAVIIFNSPPPRMMWSDRAFAAEVFSDIIQSYKIVFFFFVVISCILYVILKTKNLLSLSFLAPFILIDLISTDRDFLVMSFLSILFMIHLCDHKVPVLKMFGVGFLIISMEVFRSAGSSGVHLVDFLYVPGEMRLTFEGALVVLASEREVPFFEQLVLSVLKIFSPSLINLIYGSVPHFTDILDIESPVSFGLGGSLLAEPFGYKNRFLLILYPFICFSYFKMINIFKSRFGFFGLLVFVIAIASMQSVFRNGVIYLSYQPFYFALFAASWFWVIRLIFPGKTTLL